MKVLPFQIPKPEHDALIYQEDKELIFYDKFHQHEEIQVSFIAEGEGALVVGDTINYYKKGDVIALGSNLPHVFKSDTSTNIRSEMLTLFFSNDAFGSPFFELEELRGLRPFFKKVNYGFKVSPKSKKIETLFKQLNESSKLRRFILLLEVLKALSKSKIQPLSSFIYDKKYTDSEGKRMRDIMDFTMQNYHHQISLDDVAKVSAMTKNAFCKYFKKRTNKTYFRFLNELRVENASKLLLANNDFSIAEIADKSGFNNISNFNRQFKMIKQLVPSEYRKIKTLN
ncbi:AraC family transcriptional regulator [Pontimicrobium sp. SW4]|uniref:AraC family transcriptional regulator n=1 Tax=Pontimicrobium sp. SW4 TaxID=3153519 RepID=A0AAU7BTM0_9FLAO